jgi:ribulose 1,5-bisphosphate synthetase/thiazole synthase
MPALWALYVKSALHRQAARHCQTRHGLTRRLFSKQKALFASNSPHNIAIIGGGLAGMATAYHLVNKMPCNITIFDAQPVGKGGASAIAGG